MKSGTSKGQAIKNWLTNITGSELPFAQPDEQRKKRQLYSDEVVQPFSESFYALHKDPSKFPLRVL